MEEGGRRVGKQEMERKRSKYATYSSSPCVHIHLNESWVWWFTPRSNQCWKILKSSNLLKN